MFGYVLPVKGEMKVQDFETYRAAYCGVCKQLQKSYGFFSRFLLNYDLVLVSVVADALSGQTGQLNAEGCFVNPLNKRAMRHGTDGLALAADGLVMLSYHKLRDNLDDEAFSKRMVYSCGYPFFRHMYNKAKRRRPELAAVLETEMQRQAEIEQRHSALPDEACDPTARMCSAIFAQAASSPEEEQLLSRIGLFAGQIVYLLDAAEDFNDDKEKNRYNVFLQAGYTFDETVAATQRRCRMAAGEIALCYNQLSLLQYKPILDNIFFLGIPAGIAAAGVKRTQRRPDHGQIAGL